MTGKMQITPNNQLLYSKELYILTEMEIRQLFRRMFVTLKNPTELFFPT